MEWKIAKILDEYSRNAFVYSLGLVALGLITHRITSWLLSVNLDNHTRNGASHEDSRLSDMIIPRQCLSWRKINLSGRWHTSVATIRNTPSSPNWRPLLVFANRNSGSNQGAEILKQCRAILNPVQVHDLSAKPPHSTLELCELLPDVNFRVLVCGGDGSVSWILGAIDELAMKSHPDVSVLPLGTGNDLSIMLGWGATFDIGSGLENFLTQLRHAERINVDRWNVVIDHPRNYLGWRRPKKQLMMTNYFSVGCDALLCLNFHRQRQRKPTLFRKRSINKILYFGYGAIDVLEQHCKNLDAHMQLSLDGVKVELPKIAGILFLNVSHWGGGCQVWNNSHNEELPWTKTDVGDGKIEVMAFTSSFHMAQIQVNLAEPIRLGQVETARIALSRRVPVQADGEPWEQDPCIIEINFRSRARLLQKELQDVSDTEFLQLETD